jgi:hypothetical protein
MKLTISKEFEITPDWNGNLEEDAENQIKVRCRYFTAGERDDIIYPKVVQRDGETEVWFEADRRKAIEKGVIEIQNLSVNGKEIKAAKDLIGTEGLGDLYQELATEIISRNRTPNLGN